ncbi:MAG TPA: glycogen/starch synthase [bacterium]
MKKLSKHWHKDWTLAPYFFDEAEIQHISKQVENLKIETIVYCSYENRFGKSGGLGAVTAKILPFLNEARAESDAILITPFHSKIMDAKKLKASGITFEVLFDRRPINVEILEYTFEYHAPQKGTGKEYYLKADGFFNAQNPLNDPYVFFEADRARNDEAIRENSLFFCQAVPLALKALRVEENIVFHLQDWQTALISLTAKEAMVSGALQSCATVQTMHNSFDTFIPWRTLEKISGEKRIHRISQKFQEGLTAFQIGLQLVDAPITTVSDNFANEFTSDILQTEHFAPHLQTIFQKSGVVGVNNGAFIDPPAEFAQEKSITITKLKTIKSKNRKLLLKVLDEYHPPERFGKLAYQGTSITNLPDSIPILVMSGRLDYNQKGYDIFLQAIERFAEDEIKVVLTPMPVKQSDLDFFKDVVSRCNGNVTVIPIRMTQGFHELQIGCTFGLMPSIYEPFGAAIEYMVNGTVNIARKTGGLADQIDDNQSGLLYREYSTFYSIENIKHFSDLADNVSMRRDNRWVQSMVAALHEKIKEAIYLYQNHPNEYYRLIIVGFKKAKNFDWSKSVKKYFEVYDQVTRGF